MRKISPPGILLFCWFYMHTQLEIFNSSVNWTLKFCPETIGFFLNNHVMIFLFSVLIGWIHFFATLTNFIRFFIYLSLSMSLLWSFVVSDYYDCQSLSLLLYSSLPGTHKTCLFTCLSNEAVMSMEINESLFFLSDGIQIYFSSFRQSSCLQLTCHVKDPDGFPL